MSFSPLDNQEGESPINLPRVTMCLDKEFQNEYKEEFPDLPKTENMKVYARIRPMLQKEEDAGYRDCVAAIDDETVRAVVPANSVKFKNSGLNPQDVYDFKYTQAFGPDIGQFVFFENTIMDTMLSYIEGQNCLIFNYGITNSGKTFTLQGNEGNPGIIPLAMHLFFGCIESQLMEEICVKPDKFSDIVVLNDTERAQESRLKEELLGLVDHDSINKTSASDISASRSSKSFSQVLCECFRDDFKYQTDTTLPPEEMIAAQSALYMREQGRKRVNAQPGKCNIWVSFIEIYNEYIYDLLQPNVTQRQKLALAEDQNGDVYFKGAREICVSNSMEAIKLMHVGRRNLRIASTKLNYQSSRSHCIFTVKIARVFDDEEQGTSGRLNRISFCDLAGSERANKSQASGVRLKEAGYINTSLMVLGRCLDQLRRNQTARDKKMIPFRESKLTRLFSNHFLGKGKAVMIANASPCEYTFDETLNVLRFSALAKDLTISDSYISTAHSSILDICNQWKKSKNRISDVSSNESYDFDSSFVGELEKKDEMIEKLVDVAESLRQNLEQEKKEKVELEFKIRQEVGSEYAAYSDELLDEQKESFERQIESLREIYKQRIDALKETYENRIHDLQAELNESDGSLEMSINEINKTFDKLEEESLISFSPAEGITSKQEAPEAEGNTSTAIDTSMDFFDAEDVKSSSDIQSLKDNLESVSKELDVTKKKLEDSSEKLKESETEVAISKEKCDTLSCKLLEANQVLEEYQKELQQLKANCSSFVNEIDSLVEEKKILQDNILSLSDQLVQSTKEYEQLKKEKLEIEESYSQKLTENEKEFVDLEVLSRDLNDKLEASIQSMENANRKYKELEAEYEIYKDNTGAAVEELSILKEKFNTVSNQLAETANEAEQLKKEKLELVEDYSQKLAESEKKIADLEEKCEELNCKLEESVQTLDKIELKYNKLEEEYDSYKTDSSSTAKDLSDLNIKFAGVSEELELATTEIELLKNEKLVAETDFAEQKTKLTEEMTNLKEQCKELCLEIENSTKIATEQKIKYDKLETEHENYKKNISALNEDKENMDEKLSIISKDLELQIENLKKEKLDLENFAKEKEEMLKELQIENLKKEKLDLENFAKEKEEMLKDSNSVTEQCKILRSDLETASKELEDNKLVITELESKIATLESTCTSYKVDNSKLLEKVELLEKKLSVISLELEEAKISYEKSKEFGTELEKISLVLEQEKSKVTELVSKCSTYETENARLLKELKDSERNLKLEIEQACDSQKAIESENSDDNLSNKSQKSEHESKIAELELKIEELQSSVSAYESNNSELIDDLKSLQEKLDCVCQELEAAKSVNERSTELGQELEKITETLKDEESKVDELMAKCDCLEKENANLLQNIKNYEENSTLEKIGDTYTVKIEELTLKLEEINQLLEQKQLKIDQLETECSHLQSGNATLLKTLDAEKEKYSKLSEEQASAISEVKHLQKEITEAVDVHSKTLSNLKTEETMAKEKCKELILKLEETSKIVEDQKVKIVEAEENILKYKNLNLELSEKFDSLKESHSSSTELFGKLIDVLETCELCATKKIKLLHSSSIKNLEVLTDLSRQIREKESSIEELERALCDCQNQLKESEAKAKKQMHVLKQQHTVEIEEMSRLKQLVQEENLQLKSTVAKMEEKQAKKEEAKENTKEDELEKETVKQSSSKGRKKRSLSEVSKEEINVSQDKENSDRETRKEVTEDKAGSKRRRVLRQRQEAANENTGSTSETEEESHKPSIKKKEEEDDVEYIPVKTITRKRAPPKDRNRPAQKKTAVAEMKVPVTRTSRRKLQEEPENQSPVKKAMAFVSSKLRSVAQTVSSMPSPRITRGRRKLFNADAAAPMDRKWKL